MKDSDASARHVLACIVRPAIGIALAGSVIALAGCSRDLSPYPVPGLTPPIVGPAFDSGPSSHPPSAPSADSGAAPHTAAVPPPTGAADGETAARPTGVAVPIAPPGLAPHRRDPVLAPPRVLVGAVPNAGFVRSASSVEAVAGTRPRRPRRRATDATAAERHADAPARRTFA